MRIRSNVLATRETVVNFGKLETRSLLETSPSTLRVTLEGGRTFCNSGGKVNGRGKDVVDQVRTRCGPGPDHTSRTHKFWSTTKIGTVGVSVETYHPM